MLEDGVDIPSVNYHLWRTCNMRCKFCFATYDSIIPEERRHGLPPNEARSLIELLGEAGFQKITFAGGEPTLCPWLKVLLQHAKWLGLRTAMVTNGTTLESMCETELAASLDWLALSVDSVSYSVNRRHGRAVAGVRVLQEPALLSISQRFREAGVRLKVNTVVTRLNASEILAPFIAEMYPERWKIMQILGIRGENTANFPDLSVSDAAFQEYVRRNSPPPEGVTLVTEDNSDMTESYVMIDPVGRFISNSGGSYRTSRPILQVGVHAAMNDVSYSEEKFEGRGGRYDW
jgi:radical S-adenosyl methionine domain-containing protein 2